MKLRNLMVLTIAVFGISILAMAKESKVRWEYIKGGQGIGIVHDASYDEVWERSIDVLLFEKFRVRGSILRGTHKVITMEKDAGLIVVRGFLDYTLKITIHKKDDHIVVKTRCNSSWKKRVIEKFFQLLEEDL